MKKKEKNNKMMKKMEEKKMKKKKTKKKKNKQVQVIYKVSLQLHQLLLFIYFFASRKKMNTCFLIKYVLINSPKMKHSTKFTSECHATSTFRSTLYALTYNHHISAHIEPWPLPVLSLTHLPVQFHLNVT